MDEADNQITLGSIGDSGDWGRNERRDAAANRARILETAVRMFSEYGVENVHMADIAQQAEVGKGTLYRRFANKGELCLALMDSQMGEFQNTMLQRMQQMSINQVPYLEQLELFVEALVLFTETHSPLLMEVQREGMLQGIEDTRLQLPHFWQHMTVSGLLKTAVAKGELHPNLDIDYLADALLAPMKVDIFQFQRQVRLFSVERIQEGMRTMVAALRYYTPGIDGR